MKLLFVCLGNICRSPAAEAVMKSILDKSQIQDVDVDSAGTGNYHIGEKADPRMIQHGQTRGFQLTSIARQFGPDDFYEFDHIFCMDNSNLKNVLAVIPTPGLKDKVRPFCQFIYELDYQEVPDPYFGGDQGFQIVYDILEEGCQNIYNELIRK